MFEVINVTTKAQEGVFASYRDAEKWVATHGDPANFRIFPW